MFFLSQSPSLSSVLSTVSIADNFVNFFLISLTYLQNSPSDKNPNRCQTTCFLHFLQYLLENSKNTENRREKEFSWRHLHIGTYLRQTFLWDQQQWGEVSTVCILPAIPTLYCTSWGLYIATVYTKLLSPYTVFRIINLYLMVHIYRRQV